MASIVKSFAISGVDGYLVDVETKTIEGQPLISIVGLGDTAVKEARERVEAALRDGKFCFPEMKVVINLAPSDLKKSGSHFDLPIALGLLMESDQLHINRWQDYGCIGELSLNARLRACTGVLPMVIAAKQAGIKNIIVPRENIHEASLVRGMNVLGFDYLREVVQFLEGEKEYTIQQEVNFESPAEDPYPVDFNEVQGQDAMVEYIVVAAAENSGALITAGFATKQGKDVYALPHEIHDPAGRGVNRLIAEGVHIYLYPSQLLPDRNLMDVDADHQLIDLQDRASAENGAIQSLNRTKLSKENSCPTERTLTNIEKKVLSSLSLAPKTIEEIGVDTQIDQIQLIEVLSMMELEGLIQTYSGGRFVLK